MTDGNVTQSAIVAALQQNWKEAIRINNDILKTDDDNIDALNRLGFAYLKSGNIPLAKRCFTKVLAIDRYNLIAEKNLKKLTVAKKRISTGVIQSLASPLIFLEEPGRTKIVNCLNTAHARILSGISSGQEVYLKPKKHCVEIRDSSDIYLAVLPDDISFKLIKYIAAGNIYKAFVKSVGKNSITVFLREVSRGKKFSSQPSFTSTSNFIPASRFDSVSSSEKPDVSATGEEESETTDET